MKDIYNGYFYCSDFGWAFSSLSWRDKTLSCSFSFRKRTISLVFILTSKNKSQTVDSSTFRIWLCDPDTLLEDAMLMIALFVKKDKNFIKFVEKVNKKLLSEKYLEFTTFLSIREKQLFYRKVQSIGTD